MNNVGVRNLPASGISPVLRLWGRQSMMRVGHWRVSIGNEVDRGGCIYRPKSVSSLLMRLSAISCDCGVERWTVEEMQ